MKACLQIKQPRTSRSYFVFKIEGINLKDNSALRYIDSADNSPNRIVGLKLEKLKTKKQGRLFEDYYNSQRIP